MNKFNIEYKTGKDGLLYPLIDFGQKDEPLGKYGSLRGRFLKEHKSDTYADMLMNGTLLNHLYDIDEICHAQMKKLVSEMAKQEGIIEQLKSINPMEWVRKMNIICALAEETIFSEIVYL
ncbi:MAG: TnpV protein [Clostridia bacterium]|nr:TnpV protein [Clostridia bacterium]